MYSPDRVGPRFWVTSAVQNCNSAVAAPEMLKVLLLMSPGVLHCRAMQVEVPARAAGYQIKISLAVLIMNRQAITAAGSGHQSGIYRLKEKAFLKRMVTNGPEGY